MSSFHTKETTYKDSVRGSKEFRFNEMLSNPTRNLDDKLVKCKDTST